MAAEKFIFVADDTIETLLISDNTGIKKLLQYQIERNDEYKKIYLPPSVFDILQETAKGETKAQIENLFACFGSTKTNKIFQEVCLTGEWLKCDGKDVIFITSRDKFHRANFVLRLKENGFAAVWTFDKLDLL